METGEQALLRLLLRHLEITEELSQELLHRSLNIPENKKLRELIISTRELREQVQRQFT